MGFRFVPVADEARFGKRSFRNVLNHQTVKKQCFLTVWWIGILEGLTPDLFEKGRNCAY